MPVIVNTPAGDTRTDNSGLGMVLGALLAVLVIALLAVYALPAIRRGLSTPQGTNINVQLPTNPSNNQSTNPTPTNNIQTP